MNIRFVYTLFLLFSMGIATTSCSIDEDILTELSTGDEVDDPVGPDEDI